MTTKDDIIKLREKKRLLSERHEVKLPEFVDLRSLWPGKIIINKGNAPSGKRYVFESIGAIKPVDPEDVEYLLSLGRDGAGCCVSTETRQNYFERA